MSFEHVARPVIELLAQSMGLAGVAFIVAGALIAIMRHIEGIFGKRRGTLSVRLTLGHYTLLGLEFLVAQDLVESVIVTDFEHLLGLGAVVLIRTVLEHFLGKEVEHLSAQAEAEGHDPDPGISTGDGWWPRFRSGMVGALSSRHQAEAGPDGTPRGALRIGGGNASGECRRQPAALARERAPHVIPWPAFLDGQSRGFRTLVAVAVHTDRAHASG